MQRRCALDSIGVVLGHTFVTIASAKLLGPAHPIEENGGRRFAQFHVEIDGRKQETPEL